MRLQLDYSDRLQSPGTFEAVSSISSELSISNQMTGLGQLIIAMPWQVSLV